MEDWFANYTLAHLRIPRIELLEWTTIDDVMNVVAKLIIDQAMTALVTNTWPVHDEPLGGPR